MTPKTALCNRCNASIPHPIPSALPAHANRSDYVPSSKEKAETLPLMQEEEVLLRQYEEEVSRLEKILDTVRGHKAILSRQVNQKRSLLAPVRRIPTEILDAIFTSVHGSSVYSLTIPSRRNTILSLSRVCSTWRRTILLRPDLWSSISLRADDINKDSRPNIHSHLQRAGSHPLRIRIIARGKYDAPGSHSANALRMIIPELYRCEELVFHGNWMVLAQFVPKNRIPVCSFPHLRSFTADAACVRSLMDGINSGYPNRRWFPHALENAPKLVTVVGPALAALKILSYPQLTTIHVHRSEFRHFSNLLRLCPNLKELSVDGLVPDRSDLPSSAAIEHTDLQKLTINSYPESFAKVFESLELCTFPALRSFTLRVCPDNAPASSLSPSFLTMVQSQISLQSFEVHSVLPFVPRTWCTDVLRDCPHLQTFAVELNLDHLRDGSRNRDECMVDLIQSLTITNNTPDTILAPKLTKLCLTEPGVRISSKEVLAFLDMVESRIERMGVARLADAELRQYMPYSTLDIDHVTDCRFDPSTRERITMLSRKGIHCAVGTIS